MQSAPTYHRALLALGGVAKTLARKGLTDEAQTITTAVQEMLGVHGNEIIIVCIIIYYYVLFQA